MCAVKTHLLSLGVFLIQGWITRYAKLGALLLPSSEEEVKVTPGKAGAAELLRRNETCEQRRLFRDEEGSGFDVVAP
jgi:hypothetical protein